VYRSPAPPAADTRAAPPPPRVAVGGPPSAPAITPAPPTSSGWIEAGVGVMVLPLTVAIVAMIAPLIWMLGPKSHRQ